MKKTHGMSGTPEYYAWYHMIQRCYNKKHSDYKNYGGRGIKVECKRWRESFLSFYKVLGPRTSSKHSLDRIDNDKGYYPKNCRWATKKQQDNNRRYNRLVTYKGKRITLAQAIRTVRKSGSKIKNSTVYNRFYRDGWSIKKTLETPVREYAEALL